MWRHTHCISKHLHRRGLQLMACQTSVVFAEGGAFFHCKSEWHLLHGPEGGGRGLGQRGCGLLPGKQFPLCSVLEARRSLSRGESTHHHLQLPSVSFPPSHCPQYMDIVHCTYTCTCMYYMCIVLILYMYMYVLYVHCMYVYTYACTCMYYMCIVCMYTHMHVPVCYMCIVCMYTHIHVHTTCTIQF